MNTFSLNTLFFSLLLFLPFKALKLFNKKSKSGNKTSSNVQFFPLRHRYQTKTSLLHCIFYQPIIVSTFYDVSYFDWSPLRLVFTISFDHFDGFTWLWSLSITIITVWAWAMGMDGMKWSKQWMECLRILGKVVSFPSSSSSKSRGAQPMTQWSITIFKMVKGLKSGQLTQVWNRMSPYFWKIVHFPSSSPSKSSTNDTMVNNRVNNHFQNGKMVGYQPINGQFTWDWNGMLLFNHFANGK